MSQDAANLNPPDPIEECDTPPQDHPKKRNCGKTGPTSSTGRSRSSKNATKHGCCAWTLILPTESEEDWLCLLAQWRAAYAPIGAEIAHIPPRFSTGESNESPGPCTCSSCAFEKTLLYAHIVKTAQLEWHRIRNESNYNSCLSTTAGAMPFNWTPDQIKHHDLQLRYKITAERAAQSEFRALLAHYKIQKPNFPPTSKTTSQTQPEPESKPPIKVITEDAASPTGYTCHQEFPSRPGVVYPHPTPPPPNPHPSAGAPLTRLKQTKSHTNPARPRVYIRPKRFPTQPVKRYMRFLQSLLLPTFAGALLAQYPGLTLPPSGNNQMAAVTQYLGPVHITIEYSSPAIHTADGKDRRGQIWGKLVPYGMADLGPFGNGKPDPWRAGANQNTVFTTSDDVVIEGKPLPAGRYGLHMIPGMDEWTIIFSKNSNAWGSFSYDESADALRVTVKPHPHEYREYLSYEFPIRKPAEAVAELQWEELAVPLSIKVAKVDDIYISRLRQELTSVPGFTWQGFQNAAQYCLQENTHLEQGLKWADDSISKPFIGEENFTTLSTKAQILSKLGRDPQSKTIMDTAIKLPSATPIAIHQYGRQLLAAKKIDDAFAVFQYNATRNGDQWPIHVGLARGYAVKGDTKQALEHAKKAVIQAPDPLNKQSLEAMIKALESGQSIN